jgi:hypothetical protein
MHQAEDLVQETLAKVYVRWHRRLGGPIDNPAAYAQTALVRTFLSARRRRSSSELPYAEPPEALHSDPAPATDLQLLVAEALAGLGITYYTPDGYKISATASNGSSTDPTRPTMGQPVLDLDALTAIAEDQVWR